jgi:hypothetical protein
MSENEKKVYEYNSGKVRETLVRGFKSSGREATIADIAGLTGLPIPQIEEQLPAVADEFGARLRVTEKGQILYSFPAGMKSRYKGFGPSAKKALKALAKTFVAAGKALFKVWIMVMLVGYFIVFLALALFAMVASIAMQQGGGDRGRDSRRGGGLGGLWLTTRLFDTLIRIWLYSEFFKDPATRYRQAEERKTRRPLHKAVFSHVFGDGDPNPSWQEIERKSFVSFLQTHKGIITLPEFMAITGLDPVDAELAINRYVLEFGGSPEVTEKGSVYFTFPNLLARVGTTPDYQGSTVALKRTAKFSSNAPKADNIFRMVNLFNIVFGGYFLYNAAAVGNVFYVQTAKGLALRGGFQMIYSATGYLLDMLGNANPSSVILWGLGVVPLAFSAFFFGIPILRSIKLKLDNERIKFENLRRVVYRSALTNPVPFRPATVVAPVEEAKPSDPLAAQKIASRFAAWARAEPASDGFEFSQLKEENDDIAKLRNSIDAQAYAPGKTIFDSNA